MTNLQSKEQLSPPLSPLSTASSSSQLHDEHNYKKPIQSVPSATKRNASDPVETELLKRLKGMDEAETLGHTVTLTRRKLSGTMAIDFGDDIRLICSNYERKRLEQENV